MGMDLTQLGLDQIQAIGGKRGLWGASQPVEAPPEVDVTGMEAAPPPFLPPSGQKPERGGALKRLMTKVVQDIAAGMGMAAGAQTDSQAQMAAFAGAFGNQQKQALEAEKVARERARDARAAEQAELYRRSVEHTINKPQAETPAQAMKRRTAEADEHGLTGADRRLYILNGKVPEQKNDMSVSETELAMRAADGDPKAKGALIILAAQKKASRNVTNINTGEGDKLLTPDEASRFGVPYGTKRGEVYGKNPGEKPTKETEGQRGAADFHARAVMAEKMVAEPMKKVMSKGIGGQAWDKLAPTALASDEGRQYRQAASFWIKAALRLESGASIPVPEEEAFFKTFFPQPGDDAATIENKTKSRKVVENGLAVRAGGAATGGGGATGGASAMYATNPQTKERIVSNDGGKTWQTAPK